MDRFEDWSETLAILDACIEPIAKRPVDLDDPDWMARLANGPQPLDEAGVRGEAEGVVEEIIRHYAAANEGARREIRNLFDAAPSFAWAVKLPFEPTTPDRFRSHLVLYSIRNLGRDTRDAILLLDDLCGRACAAGVATASILREMATQSSDQDRHGMGSCRGLLLRKAAEAQAGQGVS